MKQITKFLNSNKILIYIVLILVLFWPMVLFLKKIISKFTTAVDSAAVAGVNNIPLTTVNEMRPIAELIRNEVLSWDSNEARIVSAINQLNTLDKLKQLATVYTALYNVSIQSDLATCFSARDYFQTRDLSPTFRQFLQI